MIQILILIYVVILNKANPYQNKKIRINTNTSDCLTRTNPWGPLSDITEDDVYRYLKFYSTIINSYKDASEEHHKEPVNEKDIFGVV